MVLSDNESSKWKIVVTAWAFIECLLFGGLLYGWASISFVLKAEGIYADLCTTESFNTSADTMPYETGNAFNGTVNADTLSQNTTPITTFNETGPTGVKKQNSECKPRDRHMTLCFTIGSALFCVGCAVFGYLYDKCGTRWTRLIAFGIFTGGSLMMAFTSKNYPWLMFPGLSCIGIGGIVILVTNTQVSNLFENGSSFVVGLLCGGFDMSSFVMLLMKIASENGFSRQNMFFGITALHSLVLISTFFFLPKDFIMKRQPNAPRGQVVEEADVGGELLQNTGETVNSVRPSLWNYVRKRMFLTHVGWFCLIQLRFFCFLGTLNPYLGRMLNEDDAQVSHYTNVWQYIMAFGLVTSPFAGWVYDWRKNKHKDGNSERYCKVAPAAIPQGIACLLSVVLSILVLIPVPELLYITFIVMTLTRSFLYSIGVGFIGEVFPEEHFGMLLGIMYVSGGVFGLLQYALFALAEAFTGGTTIADVVLLLMVFVSFLHPVYLRISSLKGERSRTSTDSSL